MTFAGNHPRSIAPVNYRHAYHAGNHGDVLKHAVLHFILARLCEKPTPFFVLDTHAGIGAYDLGSVEAEKTGEWLDGIGRLVAVQPPALSEYLSLIAGMNAPGALRTYPGSPAIASAMMRPGDRLVLVERHPEDVDTLRGWAAGQEGVAVHERDGYEAIGAFLPPKEARGLVVVDPPYEATDEFDRMAGSIVAGCRRWRGGRWLIWYPVKDRAPVWRLQDALLAADLPEMLVAELLVAPADGMRLAGSGVILINPPFGIEDWLGAALPQIQTALAPQHGSHALRRLVRS